MTKEQKIAVRIVREQHKKDRLSMVATEEIVAEAFVKFFHRKNRSTFNKKAFVKACGLDAEEADDYYRAAHG